jgi:hypothetical protein
MGIDLNGVGNIASPRLMPGKFAEVVKYSTNGNLLILNLNLVGSA